MCGIVGIASVSRDDASERVEEMLASLAHRGPDGRGTYAEKVGDAIVALGHARLAIIDLSPAGAQPMRTETGTTLTYNGEVYNHSELRAALEAKGARFTSRSDSEVILRGYEREGLDFLPKLRGMFAFALLDPHRRALVLARDPMGIKPLYVGIGGGIVAFASEVRPFLAAGLAEPVLDPAGVAGYLRYGSPQGPRTLLRDVTEIMPGETIIVDLVTMRSRSIPRSDALLTPPPPPPTRAAGIAAVRDALARSATAHLVSDVPVGVFLSGGIDSSIMAALMARATPGPIRTFTVGFDDPLYDERTRARKLATSLGSIHHETTIRGADALALVPKALSAMDQPSMDGMNTYVVSRAVRRAGIKVAVSGLGGDEVFAGYPSFQRATALARLPSSLAPLRRGLGALLDIGPSPSATRRKAARMLRSDATALAVQDTSRRVMLDDEVEAALRGHVAVEPRRLPPGDILQQVTRLELDGYLANTLLRDTDVMSMSQGLELRVPYLDLPVVRVGLSLPPDWKLVRGREKAALVDAAEDLIPAEVWRSPKRGFVLPIGDWLRGELREEVDRSLARRREALPGLAREATRTWSRFLRAPKGERWGRAWALYVLGEWCDRHGVKPG